MRTGWIPKAATSATCWGAPWISCRKACTAGALISLQSCCKTPTTIRTRCGLATSRGSEHLHAVCVSKRCPRGSPAQARSAGLLSSPTFPSQKGVEPQVVILLNQQGLWFAVSLKCMTLASAVAVPHTDHQPPRLLAQNNEVGFTENDVESICNIGKSSKSAQAAKIGRKGIGFKYVSSRVGAPCPPLHFFLSLPFSLSFPFPSIPPHFFSAPPTRAPLVHACPSTRSVFMVSDRPTVVSGGFAFRFDLASNGPVGAVLPQWLDAAQRPHVPPPLCLEAPFLAQGRGTLFHLPWRSADQHAACGEALVSLPVSTLLFLQRLHTLTIVIQNDHLASPTRAAAAARRVITKRALSTAAQGADSRTLEIAEAVSAPAAPASAMHVSCHQVHSVSISPGPGHPTGDTLQVAFPVPHPTAEGGAAEDEAGAHTSALAPAPTAFVFAYLPVTSSGLPFAIQADFDLVASRQELDHDSAWNHHVRGHVADAVAHILQTDPLLQHRLLHYLPSPKANVNAFWLPAAAAVTRKLQQTACIFAVDGNRYPVSEVVLSPAELALEPYPYDVLLQHGPAKLKLVASKDLAVAAALGCRPLEPGQLLAALAAAPNWHQRFGDSRSPRPDDGGGVPWRALSRLYAFLERTADDSLVAQLLSCPMVYAQQREERRMLPASTLHLYLLVDSEVCCRREGGGGGGGGGKSWREEGGVIENRRKGTRSKERILLLRVRVARRKSTLLLLQEKAGSKGEHPRLCERLFSP